MGRTILVILNPVAGKGNARSREQEIVSWLTDAQKREIITEFKVQETECVGHAVEIARGEADLFDVVCAAGGDGTVNEVVNGLMQARSDYMKEHGSDKRYTLGIIPIGRGNDFSYGAGIEANLAVSLERIVSGKASPLDIGSITGGYFPDGRYFANGIGVGFDTIVGLEAAKMKHIHGAGSYALAAIKTLMIYPKAPDVTLTIMDEKGKNELYQITPALISIMNGKRMGGSFFMAPEGDMTDGLLNLCTTEQGPRGKLLTAIFRYMKGTQSTDPATMMLKGVSFLLKAPEGGLVCHADGETVCIDGKELGVDVHPAALFIIK